MNDVERWHMETKREADRLGLGLRAYARLLTLRRLTVAARLGSQWAGIARTATLEAIAKDE